MKIRNGYVSNSSSSSFILLNNEKLDKTLEIASKQIDTFDLDKFYLEITSKEAIKETFLNKAMMRSEEKVRRWLSISVNNLWYYFENYSEALYLNQKNGCTKCINNSIICTQKLEEGIECSYLYQLARLNITRHEYESALDGMPRALIPLKLMEEFTGNLDKIFKIKKHSDGTKYIIQTKKMDDYFLDELYKFTEAISMRGVVVFDFASDCGSDEERAIRGSGLLYRIYEELTHNYVDCMWVENS